MDRLLQEDNSLLLQETNDFEIWLETTPATTVFLFNQTNVG